MGEPLDRRTDVFSMGILLWELTTGKWLYRRRAELETLKAVVETDAPRPSSLRDDYPKDLERIVMKALERSPEHRWATAGELRGALDELARSWRFQPAPAEVTRLMAAVFSDEVSAWEQARAAGMSLADHLIAQPASAERWDDEGGTDPDDAVVIETRRGPANANADAAAAQPDRAPPDADAAALPRRSPRPTLRVQPRPAEVEPPPPWWMRHQRALIASLIAGVIAGIVLGAVALLSGDAPGEPARSPDRAKPGSAPPTSETLEIPATSAAPGSGSAPAKPPAAGSALDPLPEAKVPIVYPPPLDSLRGPRPSSRSSSHPPKDPGEPDAPAPTAPPAPAP